MTAAAKTLYVLRHWPIIPMIIMTMVMIAVVFAPQLTDHNPRRGELRDRATPPVWLEGGISNYTLGTDRVGRDILTRIIHGSRISIMVAAIVLGVGGVVGTTLGLVAGYAGGVVDELIMRMVDLTLAMPFLLIALVTASVFGSSTMLVLGLLIFFSWDGFARQIRGLTLTLKTSDYVALAKVAGASQFRIIFRHIFPGIVNTLIVIASLYVGSLILAESTLSFLGVGIPPPIPSWGRMVADGRDYLTTAWWMSTFPGIAIFLVVMSMNFLGDWLRDRLDPLLRQL